MTQWDAWAQLMGMFQHMEVDAEGNHQTPRLRQGVTINEWELETELTASSVGGLFDQFIALATECWGLGVDHYRRGDETQPFVGDPMSLANKHAANLYALSKVANEQKLLSDTEADQLNCLAYDAFKLITRVQIANKEKNDKEVARLEKQSRKEEALKAGLIEEA